MGKSESSTSTSSPAWSLTRRLLVGLAAFITLIGLFYAEEDLRGYIVWHVYQRGAAARGVEFNRHALEPAPVEDEQNFAATPFLTTVTDFNPTPLKPGQTTWRDVHGHDENVRFADEFIKAINSSKIHLGNFIQPQINFVPLAHELGKKSDSTPVTSPIAAAEVILRNTDKYQPVLDELRAASARPYARFNINYNLEDPAEILLPHLGVLKRAAQVLMCRASAEMTLGRKEAAFADLSLLLSLSDALHNEPFLISHLVRAVIASYAQQIIWQGLAAHAWSDRQLQDLQTRLAKTTILADSEVSLRWEAAANGVALFDFMRRRPSEIISLVNTSDKQALHGLTILRFAPRGWTYLEETAYQRMYSDLRTGSIDLNAGRIYPNVIEKNQKQMNRLLHVSLVSVLWHHRVMSEILVPGLVSAEQKIAFGQTSNDEALIACALERYHLAKGQYPDTLAALSPQFLTDVPHDLITGEPLKYSPANDGRFTLYSVGWNEQDDGGKTGSDGDSHNIAQGDWVWPQY